MVTHFFLTPARVRDSISEIVVLKGDREHDNYGLVLPVSAGTPHYLMYFGNQGRIFKPKMERSLLFRITDKPQNFMALADHKNIDNIVDEIRASYSQELWLPLWIPSRFRRICNINEDNTPEYDGHFVLPLANIFPFTIDLCANFEATLKKYDAIQTLENEGWQMVKSNLNGRRATYRQFDM